MFGSNKCKHEELTRVQEDGYQYCAVCNTAFVPPKKHCNHVWKRVNTLTQENLYTSRISKYIYIYSCTKCGISIKVSSTDDKWAFPD
jgi:hypothetical protein